MLLELARELIAEDDAEQPAIKHVYAAIHEAEGRYIKHTPPPDRSEIACRGSGADVARGMAMLMDTPHAKGRVHPCQTHCKLLTTTYRVRSTSVR